MDSHARAVWNGDLLRGDGVATLGTGGGDLPVSWASRAEASRGKTSPEELIAAAHAACYCMALSHELAQAGHLPGRLETEGVCSFEQAGNGWRITRVRLNCRGQVPGIDKDAFQAVAMAAKDGCPVSQALAGNVEIIVNATLE